MLEVKDVSKPSFKSSSSSAKSSQAQKSKVSPVESTAKQTKMTALFGSDLSSLSSSEDEPQIEECKFTEKNTKKPFKLASGASSSSSKPVSAKPIDKSKQKPNNMQTFEDLRRKQIDSSKMSVSKALEYVTKLKTDKKVELPTKEEKHEHYTFNDDDEENKENINCRVEKKEVSKVLEYAAKLKAEQKSKEQEEEKEKEKLLETNKENINKIMAYISKVNTQKQVNKEDSNLVKKESLSQTIVLDSESDLSQQQNNQATRISPKRKETENDEEDEETDSNGSSKKKSNNLKPRREYDYEVIDENAELESQIDLIGSINLLTEAQIEYMILRDINYYIDIFSGNCDHSWRHLEYKKFSKKSGNLLYSNTALNSFRSEQYTAAAKALQSIFCRKNNKFDEYIVKVLLPEALIKMCMRIYQCGKEAAEEFLQRDNFKNNFKDFPRGSAIK